MSHAEDFGRESGDSETARRLIFDYRIAELNAVDRALCDYAVRLTLTPADMTERDVLKLRSLGLTDAQITIAVQVISYFNYINRVADGLNVDPEKWMSPGPVEWKSRKGQDYLASLDQ